jgi:hypothetical protein
MELGMVDKYKGRVESESVHRRRMPFLLDR